MGGTIQYNSGLPVEVEGSIETAELVEQYGHRVVDRVNFDRGRVRPSASLDFSVGAELWRRSDRSVRVQIDVFNLMNRLNVLNFAGLLSGTAIGVPRAFAVRLQAEF